MAIILRIPGTALKAHFDRRLAYYLAQVKPSGDPAKAILYARRFAALSRYVDTEITHTVTVAELDSIEVDREEA